MRYYSIVMPAMISITKRYTGQEMNLQQLRYVLEITRHGNHLSAAAQALNTSQPGVSRQIQLLEEELGFSIFVRTRNRIIGETPLGAHVIDIARRVMEDAGGPRSVGDK